MINLEAAKSSAMSSFRLSGSHITDKLDVISQMALSETQNMGLYDILYPYIHKDFPTLEEVYEFVRKSFEGHDTKNLHNGLESSVCTDTILPIPFIANEEFIDDLMVRAGSPINSIGYGI